jgi:hypothetical protein
VLGIKMFMKEQEWHVLIMFLEGIYETLKTDSVWKMFTEY